MELKYPEFHERLKKIIGKEKPFGWATRIGLSRGAFSRIWNEGTMPSPELLIRIKEATGINLDWLLTGEGDMYTKGEKSSDSTLNEVFAKYKGIKEKMPPLDVDLMAKALKAIDDACAEKELDWDYEERVKAALQLYLVEIQPLKTKALKMIK